jgi:hypothetical protein
MRMEVGYAEDGQIWVLHAGDRWNPLESENPWAISGVDNARTLYGD